MDSMSKTSFRISMKYLKSLGKDHEISKDFGDSDTEGIDEASIIGVVRNMPFRIRGSSVTFRQDFWVTLDDVADIVFGWRFMKNNFNLLFGKAYEMVARTTSAISNIVSPLPGTFMDIATKTQSRVSDFMGGDSSIPPPPYSLFSVFAPDFSGGPNIL